MASPSSSPRLPSPPPMAEDQISPSASLDNEHGKLGFGDNVDQGASRRIRPGTRAEDMHEGPPLVELQSIDSAFQLTEHLKALHNAQTQSCSMAMDKATAQSLAQPPPGVERGIWLYELCRFLTQKANLMAIGLFADDPPCSATTCPEMRASEWQYLCAAHEPPKSCCAIDYCCHTLDWCATALTSTKLFPSRLNLGTESASAQIQIRKMTEVFRRVYRIFAHAWFSHRDVFWRVESKTGLYLLFKTVCDEYRLIPEDNYTIPPEAEGIENTPTAPSRAPPTILQRDGADGEPAGNSTLATGNTTKRHRHTMSDRAVSVSTVIHEEVEEDDDGEQPTSDLPSAAPELTRVETVRHDEPEPPQEQDIPAEDPPPYPHDVPAKEPEQEAAELEPVTESEPQPESEPTSESTAEPDAETSDKADDEPAVPAEESSIAESAQETPTDASDASEESAADAPESVGMEEETTEEPKSDETDASAEKHTTDEDKDTSEPIMEPTEAGAADETEVSKTVAD